MIRVLTMLLVMLPAWLLAQSPWDGTWTVNQRRSTMKPGPVVLERMGSQYTLHYDAVYTFRCDGKGYPTGMALELRCRERGPEMVLALALPAAGGKAAQRIWRWRFRAAADGRTMQATVNHMRVGQAPSIEEDQYVRDGGTGAGLVGRWKGTAMRLVTPDSAVLRVHDGFLYYRDTWDGNVSDAKLDGTPAPWLDPHAGNEAWTNRLVGPRRIVGHALVDGRAVNTETLEMAADGRSIKLWLGEDESGYEILEKQ